MARGKFNPEILNPVKPVQNPFSTLLVRGQPVILDGGLGSELEARGYDLSSSLWSAELLLDQPQAIVDIHLAYLEAGAQCLTSASYQASVTGLLAAGLSQQQARAALTGSVALARSACEIYRTRHPEADFKPLVAASIGPYGAFLADGSEYRGDYGVDDATLYDFHRQRLGWFDQSGADLIACETIPSLQEARILSRLLETVNTPAWISFACRDDARLNDGHELAQAVTLFVTHPKVIGLGINCTAPQFIEALVGEIKSVFEACNLPEKTILVYPNSGEHYNGSSKTWHGTVTPLECGRASRVWQQAGASVIGGCCRMGPAHIRAMAQELKNQI